MIYKAYLGDDLFFDSSKDYEGLTLTDASVSLEYGGAGSFTFTVPPQNIAYGCFNKLVDAVSVTRDGEEIFSGRVYSVESSFNTLQTVTCEGYLAVLNDSIFEPVTFSGSIGGLLAEMMEQHNTKCPAWPVTVGLIEITDNDLYRDYENYETTKSRLDDLVDSYGGYMCIRHSGSTFYLDWYEEDIGDSAQDIEFGVNEIDLSQESAAEDIVTALIPLGADISEEVTETDEDGNETTTTNEYTVDITSVNDGLNYIIDEDGVAAFGYVWATKTWEDVTEPSNLLYKAQTWLATQAVSKVTLSVSAVDLVYAATDESSWVGIVDESLTNECVTSALTTEHYAIGEMVHVISSPHGIDTEFLCTELTFDLLDPSKDVLKLGDTRDGLVESQSKSLSSQLKLIESIQADYVTNETVNAIKEKVQTNTTLITQTAEEIELVATQVTELGDKTETLEASVTENADSIEIMVTALTDDISSYTEAMAALKVSADSIQSIVSSDSSSVAIYYCLWDSATETPPEVDSGDDSVSWLSYYPGIQEDYYIWYSLAYTNLSGNISYTTPALFTGDSVAREAVTTVTQTAESLTIEVSEAQDSVAALGSTLTLTNASVRVSAILAVMDKDKATDEAAYYDLIAESYYTDDATLRALFYEIYATESEVSEAGTVDSSLTDECVTDTEITLGLYYQLYASGEEVMASDEDSVDDALAEFMELWADYVSVCASFAAALQSAQTAIADEGSTDSVTTSANSLMADYNALISDLDEVLSQYTETMNAYFVFDDLGLTIGSKDDDGDQTEYKVRIKDDGLYLAYCDDVVACIAMDDDGTSYLKIYTAVVENSLAIGDFAYIPRSDGGVSLIWTGD